MQVVNPCPENLWENLDLAPADFFGQLDIWWEDLRGDVG